LPEKASGARNCLTDVAEQGIVGEELLPNGFPTAKDECKYLKVHQNNSDVSEDDQSLGFGCWALGGEG
jgi:hypothetical protein